jgi:hypothetical protein
MWFQGTNTTTPFLQTKTARQVPLHVLGLSLALLLLVACHAMAQAETGQAAGDPANILGQLHIDWGFIGDNFEIYDARVENWPIEDLLGRITILPVLTCTVEAKVNELGLAPIIPHFGQICAHFYDAEGIEAADPSPVSFEPHYEQWDIGARSTMTLILPADLSRMKTMWFRASWFSEGGCFDHPVAW